MRRLLLWSFGILAVAAAAIFIAFQMSPWPAVLTYRYVFTRGGIATHEALAKHVPLGVTARLNGRYDPMEPSATFDAYYPTQVAQTEDALPTVVWIHGGGFIAGSKDEIGNYLRIVAARGFAVIAVNYSLAPQRTYPSPIRQVNVALAYILRNAQRLHVDPTRIFLAGDSAGSQIAAQVALLTSDRKYAAELGIVPSLDRARLRGVVLHCGFFDVQMAGEGSHFLRTVGWSYFGSRQFATDKRSRQFSIVRNMSGNFPPMFISVGNADPLAPQSKALAEAATKLGVSVETLFFPDDYKPPLAHEYQFNLDGDAGKQALERSIAFLKRLSN